MGINKSLPTIMKIEEEMIIFMKKLWRCSVCGYVSEGPEAPDACPKCGAPKDKFIAISEEDADKIFSSDRTNDIHMEIITLAGKIRELAKEGMALLVVSSDLPEVLSLAHRIVVMSDGYTVGEMDASDATEVSILQLATPADSRINKGA